MKKTLLAATMMLASVSAHASPIFIGTYQVNDGPSWVSNPDVYSATEAAALIFGGIASDYFISTLDSLDYTTITHTGWYDGWGEHSGMEFDENYKLDLGEPGYDEPGDAYTAHSAYINDGLGDSFVNYVWSSDAADVPAPATLALFGLVLTGLGLSRKKK